MKNLTLLLATILISLGAFAQGNMATMKTTSATMSVDKMKDCCWMKDGKMWMMKDGKTMPMTKEMTLTNGTTVMANGTVKMKNGKTMTMKNGDKMDMNGNMMTSTMTGKTTTK